MAKPKRQHELVVRVIFDKPCTASHAKGEVQNCIHGVFYTSAYEDGHPEEFKVKSFKTKSK